MSEVIEALRWALAELNGTTRYDNDEQRENCFALAEAALAQAHESNCSPKCALFAKIDDALDAAQRDIVVSRDWLEGFLTAETAVRLVFADVLHGRKV